MIGIAEAPYDLWYDPIFHLLCLCYFVFFTAHLPHIIQKEREILYQPRAADVSTVDIGLINMYAYRRHASSSLSFPLSLSESLLTCDRLQKRANALLFIHIRPTFLCSCLLALRNVF